MELQIAKNVLNLNVLKRYDSDIHTILQTTSHVVLYDYKLNEWNKKGIEGTLFLYEKSNQKYGFIILNRIGLDSLQVDLMDLQVQSLGEYIMYKKGEDVCGLWIFGNEDRQSLFHQLDTLIKKNPTVQELSLEEIWYALESMAPHSSPLLSEQEFLARFQILVQSPFFARAMYIGYVQERSK
jgi:hypothetical protein